MTGYTPYNDMPDLMRRRMSFTGNSVTAIREHNEYTILSYNMTIFIYDLRKKRVVYFDGRYYSVTTSRIQNLIRHIFKIGEEYHAQVSQTDSYSLQMDGEEIERLIGTANNANPIFA